MAKCKALTGSAVKGLKWRRCVYVQCLVRPVLTSSTSSVITRKAMRAVRLVRSAIIRTNTAWMSALVVRRSTPYLASRKLPHRALVDHMSLFVIRCRSSSGGPLVMYSVVSVCRKFIVFFLRSVSTDMGGAPIGAGGTWPPLFEAKGTGGHNLGIIHISLI